MKTGEIPRNSYLNALISRKHNNFIKIVTGLRRVGKSYLVFTLFYNHLRSCGVDDDHILSIQLDRRILPPAAFIFNCLPFVSSSNPSSDIPSTA